MKLVESDRSKIALLTDDKAFRQFLINGLEVSYRLHPFLTSSIKLFSAFKDLDAYSKDFALHCRLIHSLSEGLPDAPFGKTLRECYVNLLADSSSDDWNQFTRLFSLSSAHELKTRLESALKNLKEFSESPCDSATSILLFLEQLRRLEEDNLTEGNPGSSRNEQIFIPQGKKLDKFELKAVSI